MKNELEEFSAEEIENIIERKEKMYENHIATTKKLTDGIEKLYEQEVKKLKSRLQQKENIIKEVREYINKAINEGWDYQEKDKLLFESLEILDKDK